jgi:methyltransferase-like protein
MEEIIDLNSIFMPYGDILTAEAEDGLLLVPLISGIADFENGIYSLNEMGCHIWTQFDGKITIKEIIEKMAEEYDATIQEIEQDVLGLVKELVGGKILIEKRKN